MPVMRQDPHSGGLIFSLTPQEKRNKDLEIRLENKLREVDDKIDKLDKLIEQYGGDNNGK